MGSVCVSLHPADLPSPAPSPAPSVAPRPTQAPREMSAMAKAGYGSNDINPGLLLVERIYSYIQKYQVGGRVVRRAGGQAGRWAGVLPRVPGCCWV